MRRVRNAVAIAVLLTASSASANDYRMLLEVGVGAAVPLNTYVDQSGGGGFHTIDNAANVGVNLSVLFSGWSFRFSWNRVNLTTGNFRLTNNLSNALGGLVSEGQYTIDKPIEFASIQFGYRFYLNDGFWQPYIPLELGGVAVSGEDALSRTVYGASAATGFGVDFRIIKYLYVGIALRYEFYVTEPDNDIAVIGYISTEDWLETGVQMMHMLSITAQIQARY